MAPRSSTGSGGPDPQLDLDALEGDLAPPTDGSDPAGLGNVIRTLPDRLSAAEHRALRSAWYRLRIAREDRTSALRDAASNDTLERDFGSVGTWWSSVGVAYFRCLPAVVPPTASSVGKWQFDVERAREWAADRPDPVTPDDDGFRAPLRRERAAIVRELREDGIHPPTAAPNPLHAAVAYAYDQIVMEGEVSVADLVDEHFRPCDRPDHRGGKYADGEADLWTREVLRPCLESGRFPGLDSPRSVDDDTYRFVGVRPDQVGLTRETERRLERPSVSGAADYADARADAFRSAFQRVLDAGDDGVTASDLASGVNHVSVGWASSSGFVESELGPFLGSLEELTRETGDGSTVYRFDYDGIDAVRRIETDAGPGS